jgi:hypothetical protein
MHRAKWGIGAAAVVGLAWLLSNLFNINVGGISGDGESRLGLPRPEPTAHQSEPPPQSEPETEPVATEGPDEAIGAGGVVEVLIDDRSYFLRRGMSEPPEWIAADEGAVAGYARQAPGDGTGVRVRVFRTPAARASAEEQLIQALHEAGLGSGEIDLPERLVERRP